MQYLICANFLGVLDDSETLLLPDPEASDHETWNISTVYGLHAVFREPMYSSPGAL